MLIGIRFAEFKHLVSKLDRISICMKDSSMYENYRYISDVPKGKYDDYYVYGVGNIKSEFEIGIEGPDPLEKRNMINEKKCIMECIEIVLDKEPKRSVQEESEKGVKVNICIDNCDMYDFCKHHVTKKENLNICDGVFISNARDEVKEITFTSLQYGYEVFELIGNYWGGWNECPDHTAMKNKAKEWYEQYGAVVDTISHDAVVFKLVKNFTKQDYDMLLMDIKHFAPNSFDIAKLADIERNMRQLNKFTLWWD